MHIKELKLSSNTARIAKLALNNSQIYIRGDKNQRTLDFVPDENREQLYLFPCEHSISLTNYKARLPVELVVPDASWSQAVKFKNREPILKNIQAVHLEGMPKSKYELRRQHRPEGLCTLEAVAYALGSLESKEIQDNLMALLKIMNNKNQIARQRTIQ